MKGTIFISLFISTVCSGAYADDWMVSSPDDANFAYVHAGDNLFINGSGTYSLFALDNLNLNKISFTGGNSVILNMDAGFDGVFTARVENEIPNLKISILNEYLDTLGDNDVVLRFTNYNAAAAGGWPLISMETNDGTYSYSLETCPTGTGTCIVRHYSAFYNSVQENNRRAVHVARTSVQYNPGMLLRPMIVVNMHELLGAYDFAHETYFSVAPEYSNAHHLHNAGIRLNTGTTLGGKFSVGMSAYAMKSEFQNDVSGFKADIYGGNLRIKYDMDEMLFVRGVAGISFANINCDNIVDGDGYTNNPNAFSVYGGADFGAKFNFESGLFLSPFMGYAVNSSKVVDVHDKDSFAHIGNDIGFEYFMDGTKYSYSLRTGVTSDGYLDAGIGIGIWTVSDKIGGTVSLGVLNTDFGWSGKVAANIKFAF